MSEIDNSPGGGYETTAAADMAAFDDLPMPLRLALREAPDNLAAELVARAWSSPRILPELDCLERMQWFLQDLARWRGLLF